MAKQNKQWTLEAIEQAISYIPADDREQWFKVGMGLKDEFGDLAYDIWLAWSEGYDKFVEKNAREVWKSLNYSGNIQLGTVIFLAKQFGWSPKKTDSKKITPEQYQQKMDEREARRQADAESDAMRMAEASAAATRLWSECLPVDSHPYLERKAILGHGSRIVPTWNRSVVDEETGEFIQVSIKNALAIPLYSDPKTISSLQIIFPEFNEALGRDKDFVPGGRKKGCYFKIGIIKDAPIIAICEGFATGASIFEATGYPVMIAFDAGNLLSVSEMVRAKFPASKLIIAGDNDLWTKGNPGATKANQAAWAVSGFVALPSFDDHKDKPTDFNDLRDAGKIFAQIQEAAGPSDPGFFIPDMLLESPTKISPSDTADQSAIPQKRKGVLRGIDSPVNMVSDFCQNPYFEVLGYEHETYYIFVKQKRQLMAITPRCFNDAYFLMMAPLDWWESVQAPLDLPPGKISKINAINALATAGVFAGIYDPTKIRGRGAWIDRGRIIVHMGNRVIVDGVEPENDEFKVPGFESDYVYEMSRKFPPLASNSLSDEDGSKLQKIAAGFRWTKPASAMLMSGWVALAPFGGALGWRPHIWITGGPGSGKTWMLNNFIYPLINGMDVYAQGNSTEAGIRQELRLDALPVIFDESEKNNDQEKSRVNAVIAMIRQASTQSAAKTLKGTVSGNSTSYHIQSMFCLSSIQVGLTNQADMERISVLTLAGKNDKRFSNEDRDKKWNLLQEDVAKIIRNDPDLPGRLFKRSLELLPVTMQNIKVFVVAAAKKFGNQRDGDQYGTLIAGAWSMMSRAAATIEQATELLNSWDWEEYTEHAIDDETTQVMSAIMGAMVRCGNGNELNVHNIILLSQGIHVHGAPASITPAVAHEILNRNGIKIWKDGNIRFVYGFGPLQRLVKGTGFDMDLKNALKRYPGATPGPNTHIVGEQGRCIQVPLAPLIEQSRNDRLEEVVQEQSSAF